MAALKKPSICDNCELDDFKHLFDPERWICIGCEHVQVERPQRNDPDKCRECDAKRGSKPFKKGKNLCMECHGKYMQNWKAENADHLKEYRNTPESKKKRQASVRKAIQRSPEAFVRNLWHSINKRRATRETGKKMVKQGKLNKACLDVQIDFDDLWALYNDQDGLCALSGLRMIHEFNDLCSISVDRIDSDFGYVPGNVQLLCKWVNLAKGRHSNVEFLEVLDELHETSSSVLDVSFEHQT